MKVLLIFSTLTFLVCQALGCSDVIDKCGKWVQYCPTGNRYHDYMKKNCQKTCNLCPTNVPAAPVQKGCEDSPKYANKCASFKANRYCEEGQVYYKSMQKFCAKTCELCSASECNDDKKFIDKCASFKTSGYCKQNQVYYASMVKFCPKTCDLCQGNQQCPSGPKGYGRVVGGKEAKPNTWPWQVGLVHRNKFDCGGTLIAPQWVMTAGHCVVDRKLYDMKAILGEHDWSKISGYEQERAIQKVFKYPSYNLKENVNDIALIKLDRPVKLTKQVQVACLPEKNEESTNGDCYITGWGQTNGYSSETSNTLQEVELPIADKADCSRMNFQVGSGLKISPGQICAGYGADYSKIQTGCRGDSGGPLACRYGIRWTVDGVTSFGSSRCFGFEKYTVFTKVSHYRSWIDETIKRF